MKLTHWLAGRLLSALVPWSTIRTYQAFATESWLADVEADHDQWEPDELWAARFRHPAGKRVPPSRAGRMGAASPSPEGLARPAAVSPASADGGGPPISDHELIESLVAEDRAFLRELHRRYPPS